MGAKAEWRVFAAIGAILVAITFTDLSPEGPWNDSTFTSGSLGLIGLMLLYLAWFRLTFETKGVVPTMDLWKDPEGTSSTVIGVGLVILGIAYAVGRIDFFPEPWTYSITNRVTYYNQRCLCLDVNSRSAFQRRGMIILLRHIQACASSLTNRQVIQV